MKHSNSFLLVMLMTLLFAGGAFAQDDDGYVPRGFNFVGMSDKTFSVSDTKKVHFSRGNLQYNAVQNKWRFAPRQYTYICGENDNVAQDYDGWIDLFPFGTSGWNSGATYYQPWQVGGSWDSYLPGGDESNDLTGAYANADWGVYNKISNGGNKVGMWRTLTADEWSYLMGDNANRAGKYGACTVAGNYKGVLILPDDWTLPSGCSFTAGYGNQYKTNQYTLNEFQRMEAAGAIFLPLAGQRGCGANYSLSGEQGYYWSSSRDPENTGAIDMWIYDNVRIGNLARCMSASVRLVRDSRESRGEAFDENGASYKRFSVSDTSTVRFSKGNLQYNAVQNIWRFAGKQYMYIGEGSLAGVHLAGARVAQPPTSRGVQVNRIRIIALAVATHTDLRVTMPTPTGVCIIESTTAATRPSSGEC